VARVIGYLVQGPLTIGQTVVENHFFLQTLQ